MRSLKWTAVVTAVLVASFSITGPIAAARKSKTVNYEYSLVDLGGLTGGPWIEAYATAVSEPDEYGVLNIVGVSRTPSGSFNPVLWMADIDGNFVPASDLGLPPDMVRADAVAVNKSGVVLIQGDGRPDQRGYVLVPGMMIQELPSVTGYVKVYGMNNVGAIVGKDEGTGALWTVNPQGQISGPVSLGSFFPRDINDNGVMVGSQLGQAVVAQFDENTGNLVTQSLGSIEGQTDSEAVAISDNGQWIAGNVSRYVEDRKGYGTWYGSAFVWSQDTGLVTLGTLARRGWDGQSHVFDINNSGHAVGWTETGQNVPRVAFVWKDNQMRNLEQLVDVGELRMGGATGITNDDQIVGTLTDPLPNDPHGYLLLPIQ